MIRFALSQCDHLTVLVCAAPSETISGRLRQQWIEETFGTTPQLTIQVFEYDETLLPNTSESSHTVSEVWATVFKQLVPHCNLLITSEPYGDYVATYMHIRHQPFDLARTNIPVSATSIRNNHATGWAQLPEAVKPYWALKIVLLGTESTGKTTMSQLLGQHYQCAVVSEAGRDVIDNSNDFGIPDLYLVLEAHAKRIHRSMNGQHSLVVIDTDMNITQSYGRFFFNHELAIDPSIATLNHADLYLYLSNEVPHIQDGTRLSETERNQLDASHRQILQDAGIVPVEITGTDWQDRLQQAIRAIDAMRQSGKIPVSSSEYRVVSH